MKKSYKTPRLSVHGTVAEITLRNRLARRQRISSGTVAPTAGQYDSRSSF